MTDRVDVPDEVEAGAPARPSPRARPRVVTHNVASVDGRVAISPGRLLMGDGRWPRFDSDAYADVLARHRPQVLLEGSGSLVADGSGAEPLPPATEDAAVLRRDFVPDDVVARATQGWFTVVDGRGRVRWAFKEFPGEEWAGWHLLVLVTRSTPLDYLSFLRREGIPYLVAGTGHVDFTVALEALATRFGVQTVVATGGGRCNGALLRAGVVDEIEVEVVPIVVGGSATPALFTARDLGVDELPTRVQLLGVGVDERDDGRVLLRYEVVRDVNEG